MKYVYLYVCTSQGGKTLLLSDVSGVESSFILACMEIGESYPAITLSVGIREDFTWQLYALGRYVDRFTLPFGPTALPIHVCAGAYEPLEGRKERPNPHYSVKRHLYLNRCNTSLLTLGAHVQRGLQYLVCVSVCMSVCLFVYDYSCTTGYEAAYEQYQPLQWYKGMKNNVRILLK